MKTHKSLRALCESAVFTALALALSYLKIPIGVAFGGFGGSVDLVMIPLLLCAIRWGLGWGLGSGLVFGTLKFFFAGGSAISWESMLLDYSIAYMLVGLAGLLKGRSNTAWLAAAIGCLGRFAVHFVSGVTIYAEYVSPIFGWEGSSATIYSILYNGSYMLPNTVIAILALALLQKPLGAFLRGEDLKKA
ncbi:MAG: energy-coupled thiamine transporter ThiT [Oscillospiraceae bacterium]|nr:energy-coupled thiamine transporter ThiT [Oscillospiraceae bacterium]